MNTAADATVTATIRQRLWPAGLVPGLLAAIIGCASAQEPGAAGAPSRNLVDECQAPKPGWIWCDDFDRDRLASYFEFVRDKGSFSRTEGVGVGGSSGMRAHFGAGQKQAGALHLAVGRTPQAYFRPADAGTATYRELYWRFYFRTQEGWTGGGGNKLTRATSFVSGTSWAQAMFAHLWSHDPFLAVDPATGLDRSGRLATTTYNDFPHMRWLGVRPGRTPLFDAGHVGRWYCIEAHVRLNDPGSANGLEEFWIDGRPESAAQGLNFIGTRGDYGINAIFLENYWNAGSPVAQERYFDNFVVSTRPIGC